jgi:hypothetical protein
MFGRSAARDPRDRSFLECCRHRMYARVTAAQVSPQSAEVGRPPLREAWLIAGKSDSSCFARYSWAKVRLRNRESRASSTALSCAER